MLAQFCKTRLAVGLTVRRVNLTHYVQFEVMLTHKVICVCGYLSVLSVIQPVLALKDLMIQNGGSEGIRDVEVIGVGPA
jgi:hypothetical protein